MSRFLFILLFIIFSQTVFAQLEFPSSESQVFTIDAEASTGLKKIYVLRTTQYSEATFTSSAQNVSVHSFGNLGASYSSPIPVSKVSQNGYSFQLLDSDSGYIITEDNSSTYYWIVSYDTHLSTISTITYSDDSDCDVTVLTADGSAPAIKYHTILGQSKELSREFTLSYNTLQFDNSAFAFTPVREEIILSGIEKEIRVPASLCDTEFTLSSDRFMKFWGEEKFISTPMVEAIAVRGSIKYDILSEPVSNQLPADSESKLSGSAPLDIAFAACISDAAVFTEWQISADPTFEYVDLRYPETHISHSFTQEGNSFVRFVASDSKGVCEWISEVYTISVGSSFLDCPNAFSPSSSVGTNDEWKVSFRSIISFECHIFNRWGTEIATLSHPSQGWDGKYKGKTVPTGVYFYVIRAKGADGKNYNLSGDINVINSRTSNVQ